MGYNPRILYLDLDVRYMAPTRNFIPLMLKQGFDLTLYGPGYVNDDMLARGVERFFEETGPYDFVMMNEHILYYKEADWEKPKSIINAYKKNYVFNFDAKCLPSVFKELKAWFKKTDLHKIAILLETDYYCITESRIRDIEESGCYVFSEGCDFIKSRSELAWLHKEAFAASANDNWYNFITNNPEKIISVSQFVDASEFSFGNLHSRKYLIDIPGVNYWTRRQAIAYLKSKGIRLPSKGYRKCYSLLNLLGMHPYSTYTGLLLYNALFERNIESSKYVYTCGSGLEYPIRKFYEVPAMGALLICMPCAGFEKLGFRDGVNAVAASPDQLVDVLEFLERNPDRAEAMAKNGQELVWGTHSTQARSQQLKMACAAIKQGSFAGSYWADGQFKLKRST